MLTLIYRLLGNRFFAVKSHFPPNLSSLVRTRTGDDVLWATGRLHIPAPSVPFLFSDQTVTHWTVKLFRSFSRFLPAPRRGSVSQDNAGTQDTSTGSRTRPGVVLAFPSYFSPFFASSQRRQRLETAFSSFAVSRVSGFVRAVARHSVGALLAPFSL